MMAQFVNGVLVERPVRLLLVASVSLCMGAMTPCLLRDGDLVGRPLQDGVADDSREQEEEPMPFLPARNDNGDNLYSSIVEKGITMTHGV